MQKKINFYINIWLNWLGDVAGLLLLVEKKKIKVAEKGKLLRVFLP